jgi:RNase H-like protein
MVLGDIPPFGRIIRGGEYKASKIDLSELITSARTIVQNISAQLSSETAPELILNDHCSLCEFKVRCRQTAVEKDDLSLLSRITEKERKKLRSQGLFSVTQLSYTFRPRRRPKRFAGLTKKHSLPLQALAIRERKVHVDGKPDFALSGMPVYLDVESIPNRQFYYLIGLQILHSGNTIQHSFWADDPLQEREIWASFLETLSGLAAPQLIHYGSHEKLFLKRMKERYGIRNFRIANSIIDRPVNLLSVIFGSIYFPTYSNGLKDIARYLGFEWSDTNASGLQSLHWRVEWESVREDNLKKRLIRYNAEDCEALERVTHAVAHLCEPSPRREPSANESDHVVDVSLLQRTYPQRFGPVDFAFPELEFINRAAYWDYQRSRVYVRTSARLKKSVKSKSHAGVRSYRPNKIVKLPPPRCCPRCKVTEFYKIGCYGKTVHDLRFGRSSIRRWVVKYMSHRYRCLDCKATFWSRQWLSIRGKIGPNVSPMRCIR